MTKKTRFLEVFMYGTELWYCRSAEENRVWQVVQQRVEQEKKDRIQQLSSLAAVHATAHSW
jgi:hypothetical protein